MDGPFTEDDLFEKPPYEKKINYNLEVFDVKPVIEDEPKIRLTHIKMVDLVLCYRRKKRKKKKHSETRKFFLDMLKNKFGLVYEHTKVGCFSLDDWA